MTDLSKDPIGQRRADVVTQVTAWLVASVFSACEEDVGRP